MKVCGEKYWRDAGDPRTLLAVVMGAFARITQDALTPRQKKCQSKKLPCDRLGSREFGNDQSKKCHGIDSVPRTRRCRPYRYSTVGFCDGCTFRYSGIVYSDPMGLSR